MAASYTPLGSHRDIQVLSGTQVIDVERVAATTVPSGVYFERVVPLTIFGTAAATDYIAELAEAIEQRIQGGIADSASFTQDVDASGLVFDAIEFLISIVGPPEGGGTFSTTVTVPVNLLTGGLGGQNPLVTQLFDEAIAQLNQTAAA
jgi:hypothetical protein